MNTEVISQNKIRQNTLIDRRNAVERVIKYVTLKLDEPISLHEMASMAYMSPYHFNRVFHQITGLPPSQFFYALRLETAKRLLVTTDMNVTEICFEVGYNSLGTFTSRFTELVGLSPRLFRRLAEQVCSFNWGELFKNGLQAHNNASAKPCLSGRIEATVHFEGLIFIGLFEQMIPQNRPVAGTVITHSGSFCLNSLPKGDYYLLAAALPRAEDPLEYLLPDVSKLLVGVGDSLYHIQNANCLENIEIRLRPPAITDPPILLALPNLLANGLSVLNLKERKILKVSNLEEV